MSRRSLAAIVVLLAAGLLPVRPAFGSGGLLKYPTVTLSSNLVSNPGFESGPTGWTAPSFTVDSTIAHSGSTSLKLVDPAAIPYSQAAVQSVSLQGGHRYRVTGWMKASNFGSASPLTGARIFLNTTGTGGCSAGCGGTSVQQGTFDWTYFEITTIYVSADCTGSVRLGDYGSPMGTVWFDDVAVYEELPPAVEAKLLRPSYRGYLWSDMPQQAVFKVTNNDGGQVEAVTTYDSDPGNPVVMNVPAGTVTLPISGDGVVAFRIQGQPTPAYPQYRIELKNASARTNWPLSWKNDNRFRVNDMPRFLIGVYDSGLGYGSTEAGFNGIFDTYRRLNETMGDLNAYLNYWWGGVPAPNISAMMDSLDSHQIRLYWQTANCFGSGMGVADTAPALNDQAYAQTIAAHPNYAGIYIMDECRASLADDLFAKTVVSRQWQPRGADLVVTNRPAELGDWYDVGDVLASDPYPLYGAEPAGGYPLNRVAQWTRLTKDAVDGSRPFITVLQFFQFTAQGRWPTQAELRNMSYMAVVEGAQGVWYWSLGVNALAYTCSPSTAWCAEKVEYWTRLKNVISELHEMEGVFLKRDAPARLVGSSNSNIRTRVKDGYVLAYNDTNTTQSVTFRLDASISSPVVVMGENRNITAQGSYWTDTFGPYEAHPYQVFSGHPASGPAGDSASRP